MYYFIVNLTSRTGKTKEIWERLQQELDKRKIAYEAHVTEYAGHAGILADELCTKALAGVDRESEEKSDSRPCLVVVGGDGTVNEVINGMHDFDRIYFGYIPTGSGNDLGRGLRLSKDPVAALDHILDAAEAFPMDLGIVTDGNGKKRYFAISSGIGIDADVCKHALTSKLKKFLNHLKLGKLTYLLLTVKALFTMPTTEVLASFEGGETKKIDKMIFIAGMNHPWEGGGVPMSPHADPQDGKLSVCCVYGIARGKTFFLLPLLVMGKHKIIKGFEFVDCTHYELHLKQPMVLHADGEYLGEHTNISYDCEKGKLLVLK